MSNLNPVRQAERLIFADVKTDNQGEVHGGTYNGRVLSVNGQLSDEDREKLNQRSWGFWAVLLNRARRYFNPNS